jgi:GNAT superfamily N-acetyltransferase
MTTLLDEANQQFVGAWRMFVGRMPAGETTEMDGVVALFGHIPVPFFNVCLLTSPVPTPAQLGRRLSAGMEYASTRGVPWFFALCDEWLPEGAGDVLAEAGLSPAMKLTAMAADTLAPPRRPAPELTYRRVADEATSRIISEINTAAYGMPPESASYMAMTSLWPDDSYGFLGEQNGQAVTCAATLPVDGRLYVAWVATQPEHHRKGCAEAVMRHSLQVAAERTGLRRTVLHATDAGMPVYAAMGYQVTGRFGLYTTETDAAHA